MNSLLNTLNLKLPQSYPIVILAFLIVFMSSCSSGSPSGKKWEYTFVQSDFVGMLHTEKLNEAGAEGWEAVGGFGSGMLMKRPAQ